tara:strand:- start:5086 stop:5421 length:336 start_codon:yes stop_codon:yes gene_type:complete
MPEEEIEGSPTIDLLDERFSEKSDVTLTDGQVIFLYNLVEQNVQARGFRMVQFVFDLMTKLEEANGKVFEKLQGTTVTVDKTVVEPSAPTAEASAPVAGKTDEIFTAEESA